MDLTYSDKELANLVLSHYIDKKIISSPETIIFPRRGTPNTTWGDLIQALVSGKDLIETGQLLGWKNDKGYESAAKKADINKLLGKSNFKVWRTWLCNNVLKIHYCQSCECFHPVHLFSHVLRGSKTQRDTEYRHMCIKTYYKDYQAAHTQAYHRKNPEVKREANARRRAKIKGCTIEEDLSAIQEFYRNCPKGYDIDHWMPLDLGGAHAISNLVYLSAKENRHKSYLHPDVWIERRAALVAAGELNDDPKNNS